MKNIQLISLLLFLVLNGFLTAQNKRITKQTDFEIYPIYGINTAYSEFSPVLYKDNFVFVSDREYNLNTLGEVNWKKYKHFNIFKAKFEDIFADSIVLEKVILFENNLVKDDHVGPITFNKEENEAIVTIVTHKKTKLLGKDIAYPQLYSVKKEGNKWKSLELLPFNVAKQSFAQATWSPDGKRLYFAWNKNPGSNTSNIYYVEKIGENWGTPVEVKNINTKGNEMFPYLIKNKIYFASNRPGGFGGLDLYVSENKNGEWSKPKNLGKTINTEADEFSMIFNVNKTSGYFCSNRSYGKGKDDIFAFEMIEKTIIQDLALKGRLTYRQIKNKSTEGLTIGMYDEQGLLIDSAKVNADGTFTFKKIPKDKNYTLKMLEEGEEMILTLENQKEDLILMSDKQGNFIYRKISTNKVGTLALIDQEDIDRLSNKGELAGQFIFKSIRNKKTEGMNIYLVDEDGTILMKTKTDKYGNFLFKEIPIGSNYTLKTDSEDDFDILVFNKKDQLLARLTKDSKGNFIFRKLSGSNQANILEEEEESLMFLEKRTTLMGQFVYKKVKKNVGILDVEVHDQEKLLKTTKSTPEGDFMAVGLKMSDQYKFRIKDESKLKEEPILNITNRFHQTVAVLNRDNVGFYVFDKSEDFNLGDSVVNIEVIQIEQTDIQNTEVIYYENDEFKLSPNDLVFLDKKIKELKENDNLLIRIESYASSKGSVEHNKHLTMKRKANVLQYMTSKGIHQSRIKAFSYGEVRTQEEQDEEQQRLSRKTELTIFKLK